MEEQNVIEINKYFYDLFCSVNWDTSKIASAVSDKGNINLMRQAAKRYALNHLGLNEEEYYSNIEESILSTKFKAIKTDVGLLERISDAITNEDLTTIANCYYDSKLLSAKEYKKRVMKYVNSLRSEEDIEFELLEKVSAVRSIYKEMKDKETLANKRREYFEENGDSAISLVTSFIDSSFKDVESFCECSNISIIDFYNNVVIVKYINGKIYHDFKEKENSSFRNSIKIDKDKGLHAYTIWADLDWNSDEFVKAMGLDSVNSARKEALKYANSIGISSAEFYLEKHLFDGQLHKNINYSVLYEELSDCGDTLEDVYDVVSKYFSSDIESSLLTSVYAAAPYYARRYRSLQNESFEKDLKEKLNLVRGYLRDKRYDEIRSSIKEEKETRDLNELDFAIDLLKKYVTHTSSIADFKKENEVSEHIFRKSVNLVKRLKPDLYEELKSQKEDHIDDVRSDLLEQASVILDLMDDGMFNNDKTIRDFDLLDYYGISNITAKKFFDSIKSELTDEEIPKFWDILRTESKDFEVKEKDIYAIKHQFLVQNGIREITKEEKTAVINYLKSNNVPLTNELYLIAIKRLIAGNLDLDIPLEESVLSNVKRGSARIKKEEE